MGESTFGNSLGALLTFMTGVAFVYFSFPFMSSFLTALNNVGSAYSGWSVIQFIIWAGYWGIVVLWLLVLPLLKITGNQNLSF
jgi:Sec-independent protein secretion pathway component TatC